MMKNINILLLSAIGLSVILSCKDDPSPPKKLNPFTDSRDGQEYGTVTIGDQVWMSENLNYDPGAMGGLYYNNDSLKYHMYGRHYRWETVMNGESPSTLVPSGVQGLCPEGWHLPSLGEWDILVSYLDSQGLGGPDLMDKRYWSDASIPTNSLGFNARPAGSMWSEGQSSGNINVSTDFMSATGEEGIQLSAASLESDGSFYTVTNLGATDYWSCRCLKD